MIKVWFDVFWVVFIAFAIWAVVSWRGGKAENPRLRGYGFVVDGDQVKKTGKTVSSLTGCHAEVAGVTQRHTLTRVVTVAGALSKKTDATLVIVLADGTTKTTRIRNASGLRSAQVWAAKFNALVSAAQAQPPGAKAS